jgi:hypothetical protein
MKFTLVRVLCTALVCHTVFSCSQLRLHSTKFQSRLFAALPISRTREAGLTCGRPAYMTVDNTDDAKMLYLYHSISGSKGGDKASGLGRWVINDVLGNSETALSFHNSWAVHPTLSSVLVDNAPNLHWKVHDGSRWVSAEDMRFTCSEETGAGAGVGVDTTIYFDVKGSPWKVGGFFVEHDTYDGSPVYSHIGSEDERQTYLYKQQDNWMIGHDIGSSSGLAYTTAP